MTALGGRQVAPTLAGIADNHLARYRFAVKVIRGYSERCPSVLDVGCGCGYGSFILASEGKFRVAAIDIDQDPLDFGATHYKHPLIWLRKRMDISAARAVECIAEQAKYPPFAVTLFEVMEHIKNGDALLARFAATGVKCIVGSVPYGPPSVDHPYHERHYYCEDVRASLESAGWTVAFLGGQLGKFAPEHGIHSAAALPRKPQTIVFVGAR